MSALLPSILNPRAQGQAFLIECKLLDFCNPANPARIRGSQIDPVYISRADSAKTPDDDVVLPDPSTLPCPDPILGSRCERGIVENSAARQNTPKGAWFKFDRPSDGSCETLEGSRQDLATLLSGIPDNTRATGCITGRANGNEFTGCTTALMRNKGSR